MADLHMFSQETAKEMDPRLQRFKARLQMGIAEAATQSTSSDEIAVIARVSNVDEWESLSEVRVGANLGAATDGQSSIVTARIPISRIEHLRSLDFVESLKGAQPLQSLLSTATKETKAQPSLLPTDTMSNGGRGCVVGVVDYGCDYAHENFIKADGTSRLMAIWDQNAPSQPESPHGYGREYTQDQIDTALKTPVPYQTLGYAPRADTRFQRGMHGTHVMDIAAGNGRGSSMAGVAPEADLVFVDVSHADIAFSGSEVIESNLGDSVRLLEAVKYIFDKAGDRPCVVNLSLGTNGGPHDGSTLVEQGLDSLLRNGSKRAITIAASNSYADGIHATGVLQQGEFADLQWRVPVMDFSHNELEVWYDGADRFDLELFDPDGNSLGTLSPGENGSIVEDGELVAFAANRLNDPNNGDNLINIFLESTASSGVWTVRLHAKTVSSGTFHAWIERDNRTPSSFEPPHINTHTIGSISCGFETIVVGSYDANKPRRPISYFSSAGPTRDNRHKPDLSAPGHGVWAAHSRTKTQVVPKNGTSMAAPVVCGVIALMMSEARSRGFSLTNSQIRKILIETARSRPPNGRNWNDRYGGGRIDAKEAIQRVIDLGAAAAGQTNAEVTVKKSARRSKRAPRKKA